MIQVAVHDRKQNLIMLKINWPELRTAMYNRGSIN